MSLFSFPSSFCGALICLLRDFNSAASVMAAFFSCNVLMACLVSVSFCLVDAIWAVWGNIQEFKTQVGSDNKCFCGCLQQLYLSKLTLPLTSAKVHELCSILRHTASRPLPNPESFQTTLSTPSINSRATGISQS